MKKVESNLLTPNQFTKIIVLSIIGIGIFNLPNDMVKGAKQDGWISIIIGVIYPLFIVLMASFFSKIYPDKNILVLSKKYLGNILGSIMNFIFLLVFIIYIVFEAVGVSNLLRTYVIDFLSSFRFLIIVIPLTAFTAYKGLKVLSFISEIVFFNVIIVVIITLISLYRGSYLNVMPILQGGILNVIKNAKNSLYAYAGVEVILLIYPRISDTKKITFSSIKAILITCIVNTWFTFVTIYYFGVNIINKTFWAGLYIVESLRIPLINNFRLSAMFLYIFVSINILCVYYYCCGAIAKDFIKNLSRKKFFLATVPLMIILCLLIKNEVMRREYFSRIFPFTVAFNIFYVSIISLLIIVKKGINHEK